MPRIKVFYATLVMVLIISVTIFIIFRFGSGANTENTHAQPVSTNSDTMVSAGPKIKIATSIYPLADFTKQVGGNLVDIINITPPGVEPHDFEPLSKNVQQIYTSKLFVFNGAGIDGWAENIQSDLKKQGVQTIQMSSNFELLRPDQLESTDDEKQENLEFDPHIWINPEIAKKEVEIIRDKLTEIDPSQKDIYQNNASNFISQLDALDEDFSKGLADCKYHEVVVSHNFLGYLAKKYNFSVVGISGLDPESEPSSKDLAQITKLVQAKGIKYIFTENLVSPKLSETISAETGAKVLSLNSVESLSDDDISAGKNYLSLQKENLASLKLAMECK